MMRYHHRFDAHIENQDFRTNLTAAGGCAWPTIPAARYLLTSDNAIGAFAFLQDQGCLIGRTDESLSHDQAQWSGPLNICPVTYCLAWKTMLPDRISWSWAVMMKVPLCAAAVFDGFGPFTGKCNKDVLLGNMVCVLPSVGETGTDLQMRQVEHDETWPPFYVP